MTPSSKVILLATPLFRPPLGEERDDVKMRIVSFFKMPSPHVGLFNLFIVSTLIFDKKIVNL